MAEIRGDRAFIFGKDATDLVDLLVDIVCRQLQQEAEQEAAQPACTKDNPSREYRGR